MLDYFITEHPITSFIAILAIVTAIAVAAVYVPCRYAAEHQCNKRADMLNTEYQFGVWEGCWVRGKDGAWVEYNTIRNNNLHNTPYFQD